MLCVPLAEIKKKKRKERSNLWFTNEKEDKVNFLLNLKKQGKRKKRQK